MALSVVNEDFYNDLSLEAVLTGLNCNNHFFSRVSRRLSPSLSIFAKAASGSGLPACEQMAQAHLAGLEPVAQISMLVPKAGRG